MGEDNRRNRPRAARRPESISRSRPYGTEPVRQRQSASRVRASRSAENATYYRRRERDSRVRSGRELAEIKKEQRQIAEYKKEREWQNEVERVSGGVDKIMLAVVLILLTLGTLMIYSASYPTGQYEGDSLAYLKKHAVFMILGGFLMLLATLAPYRWYKSWGPFAAYGFSIVLLLAVLVMGVSQGDAKRWIIIGPISLQPSEIMKFSLVLILAWYIDKYSDKIRSARGFKESYTYNTLIPFVFVGAACILVILEKHLSGTVILGVIGVAVMLVAGCNFWYTVISAVIAGGAAVVAFVIANPYALKRLTTFTSEDVDVLSEGWQTSQGILAIGSGGPFGVGFAESRQKFGYVSEAHNDFIFTIWCEELGFVGAVLLIALFLVFVWRGYVIAMRAPDTFSMLTVFGITTQVGLQAMLNMMVVCDIIPNTGISLPFFSYGGSSLIMLMLEMGIILSISRQYYRKKA